MDASTRVMVASASLQSRMTIPYAQVGENSHYRLVDETTEGKQKEERDKIIREIEAKRASKRATAKISHPFEAALSVHGNQPRVKRAQKNTHIKAHKFESSQQRKSTTSRSHEEIDERDEENNTTTQSKDNQDREYIMELEQEIQHLKNSSRKNNVEEQVMLKLAEFKQAQQRDLEVVEQLVKQKQAAEEKIQHLQRQLKGKQMKESGWKKDNLVPAHPRNLPIHEPPTFDESYGDECAAPPDFDMGPRTASSLGEPPGFDDLEPSENVSPQKPHTPIYSTPRAKKTITPRAKTTTTWATRVSTNTSRSIDSSNIERHGGFFEEKELARKEQLEIERIAREKLERAKKATPPAGLLNNEAKLRERKQKKVEDILLEEEEKLEKFKARDAPEYPLTDIELIENLRKERVACRAAALLAQSKLPSRLADAASKPKSVRVSPKKRIRIKANPVPDFTLMQTEWKATLQRAKMSKSTTQVDQFSITDPDKVGKIHKKKQERLDRQAAKEAAERAAAEESRKKAFERAMENAKKGSSTVVETESQKLRSQAVQAMLKQRQLKEKAEAKAQLKRNAKIKQLSKQVKAEVTQFERQRKEEKGNFVENPEEAAKIKAAEDRKAWKESIQRNKERIMGAVASRPTLMERFAIDKKKDENKKQALAAIVSHVIGKNKPTFKGVLTEGEEDIIDAIHVQKSSGNGAYDDQDFETE